MNTHFSKRQTLIALATSLVASTALLSGCDNTPSTVKIGVAQPLSGNLAEKGQDLLNGVKLAVADINKEGFQIKGKTVLI